MLRWLSFLALFAAGHAWFNHKNLGAPRSFGRVSGQRWGDFGGLDVQVSTVGVLEQPVLLNAEATPVVDISSRVFASLGDLSDRPPTREELEDIFELLDTNKDGTLQPDEFVFGVRGPLPVPCQYVVNYVFQKLDLNASGFIEMEDLAHTAQQNWLILILFQLRV